MKRFKRVLALLAVAVLVMSMGMGAMAAESEATVDRVGYDHAYFAPAAESVDLIGHTFNAVQVVAAESYDAETKEYMGLSWGAQIEDDGVAALLTALKANSTLAADFSAFVTNPAAVTETKPLFTAAAFADVISDYTDSPVKKEALIKVIKGLDLTGQKIIVSENMNPVKLDAGIGLYMVDDTTKAASLDDDVTNASILMAVPGSNIIRIKVDKPKQDKEVKENATSTWNEVSDYNIGDYVPYRITSNIPNAEKFENYTMTFTDKMSAGLTFADTVTGVADAQKLKITVGGTALADTAYTLTPDEEAHGFTLELPVKTSPSATQTYTEGSEIVIEFFGLLNENAAIGNGTGGNTNKSTLKYSNDPDSTSTATTTLDTVITFTYELDVLKIDGATEKILPGAQFALKATSGEHSGKYAVVDKNGILTGWTETKPEKDATTNGALLISGEDGKFNVVGLDCGEYLLTEIKAPAGYNLISPDIVVEIKATTKNGKDYTDELQTQASNALTKLEVNVPVNGTDALKEGKAAEGIVEIQIENNSGSTLPETGGIGTTLFYIIGAILVIGAGVLLVARRRMNE